MRVPEVLKVSTLPLFGGEEDHDAEDDSHDPTRDTGTGSKVGTEECDKLGATRLCVGVGDGEFGKVDHVGEHVHGGADDDRPGGGLMESDVLVKGDDLVEGSATEEGDKIAADGE
jgi:hypothetical protein